MNRPSSCNHEDWPCCGCGEESRDELEGIEDIEERLEHDGGDTDEDFDDAVEDRMTDVEADADTLRSAGWGMDEDYGDYGHDDFDG